MATLLLSCSTGGNPPAQATADVSHRQAGTPTPKALASDAPIEDQILVSVSKALRQAKLLTRPDQCYAYRFDPSGDQPAYTVDVRENHNHPECGGDPQTQPYLFTVRIDKTTRALSQDARSPGTFQTISP